MNLSEIILLNVIFIFFPLSIYLFYIAHNHNVSKEENNMFFGLALFSSLYLLIKFGFKIYFNVPALSINIPIFLAYFKNRKAEAIVLSIFVMIYYFVCYDFNFYFLLIEYVFFYLLYSMNNRFKINDYVFAIFLIVLKGLFFYLSLHYYGTNNTLLTSPFEFFALFISSVISIVLIIFCLKIGDEILKFHMNIRELEQEKQIRLSLFKITHEIKNPLAVMKGYVDMFDVNNDDHSKRYIPIIKGEIDRTLILLQDFLTMTKINIDKELIDINLLLEEVCNSMRPLLNENKIDFITKISRNEIYIFGDYNRLNQVIINLVKNSIESFSTDKNKWIKIYTKLTKKNIVIFIEDNGSGISKENLEKIKEPFFTTKNRGTGLGVSLSSEIILAHKGEINYYSEIEVGTKVELIIPIKKDYLS
ncbi:MAG: HAMP domain-containing sensor histidine kinase [Bacilli bacterium]|nr:HAMP domain-containing sensor histidine kinase [Bacilli bacterium]MDD4608214.1 HAMP domain-containing sensor histidine kinase [Bacilli bacterium]